MVIRSASILAIERPTHYSAGRTLSIFTGHRNWLRSVAWSPDGGHIATASADKTCRILSGGEKARVVLARILYARPNFLVLDEPTNHLDITTKDMIVRSLADYEGTMLFVSHDRQFLARLSNRVLELGPDGPTLYGGGYTEYVQRSGHEAPGLR